MLLRNKNLTCTVPKRVPNIVSKDKAPVAPFPDPLLAESMQRVVSESKDQVTRFKLLVFRMPESLKTDFKMALLKNHLDIQHTFEAFTEIFIAWTEGEKIPDAMKAVLKRSITLMNGV